MSNIVNRENKFFIGRISKRDKSVKYLNMSDISGHISYGDTMTGAFLGTVQKATKVAAWLTNSYAEVGIEIHCYPISSAETNTHFIANIPDDYKEIVVANFTTVDEAATEEPEPELPPEDGE